MCREALSVCVCVDVVLDELCTNIRSPGCMHTHMHAHTHTYTHTLTHTHTHTHTHARTHTHTHLQIAQSDPRIIVLVFM